MIFGNSFSERIKHNSNYAYYKYYNLVYQSLVILSLRYQTRENRQPYKAWQGTLSWPRLNRKYSNFQG